MQELTFPCKFCERIFSHCAALGGHVSKAHPGQSTAYLHKKQVRDTRELQRLLHQEAVMIYKEREGQDVINRNTIKRIKKELVKR